MKPTALVTGASGFVGANLVRRLLRDGYEVHALLRAGYRPWRLTAILPSLRVHTVDLEDRASVERAVTNARPEWVFHLAAHGAYSNQQGIGRMVSTNLLGCTALLDASIANGVSAFVNAGSSSEYGWKDHAPDEEEPLEPNSYYAITKGAAAQYCRMTARNKGINAVTLRLYSVYGPWEEPSRFIPALIAHCLRGELPPLVSPETARDFVYVDDVVDAMTAVAAAPAAPPGAIYNVCTGVQLKIRQAVEHATKALGVSAEAQWGSMLGRSWDTDTWVGSPDRLYRDLGWKASTDFTDGFDRTVKFMRSGGKA